MNVEIVRNWEFPVLRQSYAEKDTMLYALALGYGADPVDPGQLRFVYEDDLVAVPTLATTLCHPGFWIGDPRTGIDVTMAVHGEQRMRFHAPLPSAGRVRGETRVADIVDKGKGKGALLVVERVLFDDATGQRLASTEQVTMCRGDGGFSADAQQSRQPATASGPSVPERAPDRSVDVVTLPQAALMYRLCADPNPLHADPSVARAAGFDRPILHGLCTYGIAARAIIETCCGNDPRLLRRLDARFSAPVFPGETIRTQIWRDGEAIRFHCLVAKRGIVVISSSVAEVGESVPA